MMREPVRCVRDSGRLVRSDTGPTVNCVECGAKYAETLVIDSALDPALWEDIRLRGEHVAIGRRTTLSPEDKGGGMVLLQVEALTETRRDDAAQAEEAGP